MKIEVTVAVAVDDGKHRGWGGVACVPGDLEEEMQGSRRRRLQRRRPPTRYQREVVDLKQARLGSRRRRVQRRRLHRRCWTRGPGVVRRRSWQASRAGSGGAYFYVEYHTKYATVYHVLGCIWILYGKVFRRGARWQLWQCPRSPGDPTAKIDTAERVQSKILGWRLRIFRAPPAPPAVVLA